VSETFRLDIDPQELAGFVRDMKQLEGGKRQVAALRRNLKAAAEPAAAQVRRNASWSSRIPAAVAVRVAFTAKRGAGVSVFVGRKTAPHARPIENFGSAGSFQHFTWGTPPIVTQQARPFFFDEMASVMPEVEKAALEAIDEATKAAGFR
jgi:hypothetical protein